MVAVGASQRLVGVLLPLLVADLFGLFRILPLLVGLFGLAVIGGQLIGRRLLRGKWKSCKSSKEGINSNKRGEKYFLRISLLLHSSMIGHWSITS